MAIILVCSTVDPMLLLILNNTTGEYNPIISHEEFLSLQPIKFPPTKRFDNLPTDWVGLGGCSQRSHVLRFYFCKPFLVPCIV